MSYLLSAEKVFLLRSNASLYTSDDPFSKMAEAKIAESLPVIEDVDDGMSMRERCLRFDSLVADQHAAFIGLYGDPHACEELSGVDGDEQSAKNLDQTVG